MKKKSRKTLYLNDKQRQLLSSPRPFRIWVGGRGSGKSACISFSIYEKVQKLPGSAGILTTQTIKQIKTKTILSIKKMWKLIGLKEDIHYVTFKRPPKSWIAKSIAAPSDFEDCIYFANGTYVEVVSATQQDSVRGGSYDFFEIDEAAFFKEEFFTRVVLPSRRGNQHKFDHHSHHQVSIYTSMPWKSDGKWVLDFEEKAEQDPFMFLFMESTTEDNIEVFGRDNFEQARKATPYLEFMVEYMNMRLFTTETQFYTKYDDDKHLQDLTVYQKDKALDMSVDFGGWYTVAGIFQKTNDTEHLLSIHDANEKESIRDLAHKINKEYAEHKNKVINVYGEPRGHNKTSFGNTEYEELAKHLRIKGWTVVIKVGNKQTTSHEWRHTTMNEILEESNPRLPRLRIYSKKAKSASIALKMAEIKPDKSKNKAMERDRKANQAHATHATDMIDYFFMQKYGWILLNIDTYLPNSAG